MTRTLKTKVAVLGAALAVAIVVVLAGVAWGSHTPPGRSLLWAGTWTVGAGVTAGHYVVTPPRGQEGALVVSGPDNYMDVLGSPNGVPSVSVDFRNGDVIQIAGMSSVTLTPTGA